MIIFPHCEAIAKVYNSNSIAIMSNRMKIGSNSIKFSIMDTLLMKYHWVLIK